MTRNKWTCPECGFRTIGYGIYSHQQKHYRQQQEKIFKENIEPHIYLLDKIRDMRLGELDMAHYNTVEKIRPFLKGIPDIAVEYIVNNLCFSNKARSKFLSEMHGISLVLTKKQDSPDTEGKIPQ